MIPIRDDIPASAIPIINYALIALCTIGFGTEVALGSGIDRLIEANGLIPERFLTLGERFGFLRPVLYVPFLTSIFLHGGYLHFLLNMLFLWIFGDNVEDRMGHAGYTLFFLTGGGARWRGPRGGEPGLGRADDRCERSDCSGDGRLPGLVPEGQDRIARSVRVFAALALRALDRVPDRVAGVAAAAGQPVARRGADRGGRLVGARGRLPVRCRSRERSGPARATAPGMRTRGGAAALVALLGCAPPADVEPARTQANVATLYASHAEGERFFNPWHRFDTGPLDMLRWTLSRNPYDKSAPVVVPRVPNSGASLAGSEHSSVITWVGHSTFAIHDGEDVALTDPQFGRRALWPARESAPGMPIESIPPHAFAVISHNHYDHLDAYTVEALPDTVEWYVPLVLGAWFQDRGRTRVTELDWWESARRGRWTITCLPSQHWSRRFDQPLNSTLWCSWLLDSGSYRYYFAGDTGYFHGFVEYGQRLAPIDVALLPDRSVRAALVHALPAPEPGGGLSRVRRPRRPLHAPHALGHLRPDRRAGGPRPPCLQGGRGRRRRRPIPQPDPRHRRRVAGPGPEPVGHQGVTIEADSRNSTAPKACDRRHDGV